MADEEKIVKVILTHPETPPMSKWEKAFVIAASLFLAWDILTGPHDGRKRHRG